MKKSELLAMIVSELKALAKKMKVTLPSGAKKADIVGALSAAFQRKNKNKTTAARKTSRTRRKAGGKRVPAGKPAEAPVAAPAREWKLPPGAEEPLMAQERGDVRFIHQSMYYPVTDAAMDTGSYEQFAEGYFLTVKSMEWFWNAYLPDAGRRAEPFASPLRASDEQLTDLPPAFVIVDEADVLRDEGEAYAARLRAAGVAVTTVRYDGITHDFMMLNPLSGTHATRAAGPPGARWRRGSRPRQARLWALPRALEARRTRAARCASTGAPPGAATKCRRVSPGGGSRRRSGAPIPTRAGCRSRRTRTRRTCDRRCAPLRAAAPPPA